MENGHKNGYNNVSVINTRCVNYLLTKLRKKETDSKVCIYVQGRQYFLLNLKLYWVNICMFLRTGTTTYLIF